jgi:hypothetical protein
VVTAGAAGVIEASASLCPALGDRAQAGQIGLLVVPPACGRQLVQSLGQEVDSPPSQTWLPQTGLPPPPPPPPPPPQSLGQTPVTGVHRDHADQRAALAAYVGATSGTTGEEPDRGCLATTLATIFGDQAEPT